MKTVRSRLDVSSAASHLRQLLASDLLRRRPATSGQAGPSGPRSAPARCHRNAV